MPQVKFVLTKKCQHGVIGQVVEMDMPKGYELSPRQASLMTEYKEPDVKRLVVNGEAEAAAKAAAEAEAKAKADAEAEAAAKAKR